ncbi:MAG: DNA primase, partial [Candidatus Sulfotelmatobacter sp.]
MKRPEGARAREYLTGRGLNEDTIVRFRIGYAPDSGFLLRDRLAGDFSEEVLRESGLFSWKQEDSRQQSALSSQQSEAGNRKPEGAMYSKFRNRVMFPIANEAGKIIAFTGRTLATDEKAGPKYLNSPETGIYSKGRVLFNLDHAKEAIRKLDYAI